MKSSGKPLETVMAGCNEATRRLNPQLFGAPAAPTVKQSLIVQPTTEPQKALRQKTKGPNKAEQNALDFLNVQFPFFTHELHAMTVDLANGTKWTPDIVTRTGTEIWLWDVKAMRKKKIHVEDDAAVKAKVCARVWYPMRVFLIWYDKDKATHQTQEILK